MKLPVIVHNDLEALKGGGGGGGGGSLSFK